MRFIFLLFFAGRKGLQPRAVHHPVRDPCHGDFLSHIAFYLHELAVRQSHSMQCIAMFLQCVGMSFPVKHHLFFHAVHWHVFAVRWHVLSWEAPSIFVTILCLLCMFSALQFRAPRAVQKRGLAMH